MCAYITLLPPPASHQFMHPAKLNTSYFFIPPLSVRSEPGNYGLNTKNKPSSKCGLISWLVACTSFPVQTSQESEGKQKIQKQIEQEMFNSAMRAHDQRKEHA